MLPAGLRPSLMSLPSRCRPSMSGLHLAKRGREHRKMDLQRDFTVASPAEFVTRFGGNRVIEKVASRAALPAPGGGVLAFHRVSLCSPCCPHPPGADRALVPSASHPPPSESRAL